MNIVFLDADTLGSSDFSRIAALGSIKFYNLTNPNETKERIKDADIIITNKVCIGADELAVAKNLKLICVAATGYNIIDIDACKSHNVAVTNARGYSTKGVVQHTVATALALTNKLVFFNNFVLSGSYSKNPHFSCFQEEWSELSGKRWGIIGMGEIGSSVAKIAECLGCEVVYYSVTKTPNNTYYKHLDLDELLKTSDIISLHCPLSDLTKNLLHTQKLDLLKQSAIVINVSRGKIVDETYIAKLINENKIGGYGCDVFDVEPINEDNPLLSCNSERVILTPHIAWASKESRENLVSQIVQNIQAFYDNVSINRIV